MTARTERLLLVITPMAAMAAVALGLRVGAPSAVRAAVVYGAPVSKAGTGLAWQVVAFDEDRGARAPLARTELDVAARGRNGAAYWKGETNDDGAAEMRLLLPDIQPVLLEVRAAGALLARGPAEVPATVYREPPRSAWARFARREGSISLDVAVLGQRVASGFPASIWVRATDAVTHVPIGSADVEPDVEAGLSTGASDARTDGNGWAHLVATPMGYGVALVLHAHAPDGRTGEWAGALFVSPGAAQILARERYGPHESPTLDIVVPNVRTIAYVEIDDAHGRAWGAALPLVESPGSMPRASIRAAELQPGLYWAVASSDPFGAAQLGPGTIARPFFVAETDEAALAFGTDEACNAAHDPHETGRALGICLALAGATPVPRWTALDGFAAQREGDARKRARGLSVALIAIAVAMLLEGALLLRAAQASHARLLATASEADPLQARMGSASNVGIALLVALLGFALLAAFLARAA